MLIALAISAMLLTAVTVALNASFYAYAAAAESASTHSSLRLVMQRVMRMVRTTTLHDAHDPNGSDTLSAAGAVRSVGLKMYNHQGQLIQIWWEHDEAYDDEQLGDLWYKEDSAPAEPLLERVRARLDNSDEPYIFTLTGRDSPNGLLLNRATLDLTVEPGADATLSMESAQGSAPPVRLVASAMPRRNLE